jgi:hypothetical protein
MLHLRERTTEPLALRLVSTAQESVENDGRGSKGQLRLQRAQSYHVARRARPSFGAQTSPRTW